MLIRSMAFGGAVVTLTLALQGCGGPEKEAAVEEINRVEVVPVQLSITMKGGLDVVFADTVSSHFVVQRTTSKSADEQNGQVVGTEPVNPIRYGRSAFVAGVSILPYTGDGEYTISIGSPHDLVKQAQAGGSGVTAQSSIKVDWWGTGDVTIDPETFMRRAQPCTAVVTDKGTRGMLRCPDVTNEAQDKHFSLELSWIAPASTPDESNGQTPEASR